MLEAKKSLLFEKIFCIYNRNLLERRFHSLQASGLEHFNSKKSNLPMIIYANHSSWWDGLIIFEILRNFDFENYVMMEEKNLRKLFLFRKLGAFSVNRENKREAAKSINYAVELLAGNPNRTVLIFPQSEILPNDLRPLRFYSGLSRIIEKISRCFVVPIALRLEFLGEFKPEIFVKIGKPDIISIDKSLNRRLLTKSFEEKLTLNLDTVKKNIVSGDLSAYEKLF